MGMMTQHDLERIARMLTHEFGVNVIVAGTDCRTQGKTIYLPNLPEDLASDRVLSLIRYFLDHECGHLIGKSDPAVLAKYESEVDTTFILNTLEDVRVEAIMSAALAGCGVNLRSGANIVSETLAAKAKAGDAQTLHPLKQFATCIYEVGRGLPISDWIDPRVQQVLGPLLLKARQIPQWAKSTADLEDFAKQLALAYRKLTTPPPAQQPQPQPGSEQGQPQPKQENGNGATSGPSQGGSGTSGSGKSGEGQPSKADVPPESEPAKDDPADSGADAGDADADDEAGAGDAEADKGDDGSESAGDEHGDGHADEERGPANSSSSQSNASGGSGADNSSSPMECETPHAIDLKSISEEAANEIKAEITEGTEKLAATNPFTLVRPYDPNATDWKDVKATDRKGGRGFQNEDGDWQEGISFEQFIKMARDVGGPMRQKLSQLLMAEARVRWHSGLKRGSPDPRKLAGLVTGTSNRVMRKFVDEQAPDTACSLLIDLSGSMGSGGRWLQAGLAASAFCQVLDSCGHASTVVGFKGGGSYGNRSPTPDMLPGIGACEIRRGKKWSENFRNSAPKIRTLIEGVGGGTPLASGILAAARDLMTRREKRRVLMVFTDGQPNGEVGGGNAQLNEAMYKYAQKSRLDINIAYIKFICSRLEKQGVEVVIIGIGYDVSTMHFRTATCNSIKDLSTVTMKELTKALHAGVHL